ncbi:MAG: Mini-ribonuclease 3 [Oscillatoriales cyanobacterium SM2_2_1]|nr:Mini-ribonuclease 3 [Oscillatoriales cyanobacterium SM2_2_1]
MFLFPEQDASIVAQSSAQSLAYVGDAIYELYARLHCFIPLRRSREYHSAVVDYVRAESQANALDRLTLASQLTDPEREVVRWGRNGCRPTVRRADPDIYQKASGLECLIGYLYLTDRLRLQYIMQEIFTAPTDP